MFWQVLRTFGVMTDAMINEEFHKHLSLLSEDEKKAVLAMMRSMVEHRKDTQRLTIAEYNKELDEANARIEAGFFTTHEDAVREAESW